MPKPGANLQIAGPVVADLAHVACEPVDQLNGGRVYLGVDEKGIRLGCTSTQAKFFNLRYAK
jgi:hypothetical protein